MLKEISKNISFLERVARIELAQPGRKHGILPLNYTRITLLIILEKITFFNKISQKFQKTYHFYFLSKSTVLIKQSNFNAVF